MSGNLEEGDNYPSDRTRDVNFHPSCDMTLPPKTIIIIDIQPPLAIFRIAYFHMPSCLHKKPKHPINKKCIFTIYVLLFFFLNFQEKIDAVEE